MGTGARENAPASLDDFNEKMMRFNEGPNCFGKIVANAGLGDQKMASTGLVGKWDRPLRCLISGGNWIWEVNATV